MKNIFKPKLIVGEPFPVVSTDQSMDGRSYSLANLNDMVETKTFLNNIPYIAIGHDGIYGGGADKSYGSIDPKSLQVIDNTLYVTPSYISDYLIEEIKQGYYQHESVETTIVNYNNTKIYNKDGELLDDGNGKFRYFYPELVDLYFDDPNVYDEKGNILDVNNIYKHHFLGFAVLGRVTPNFPQFKISDLISVNNNRNNFNNYLIIKNDFGGYKMPGEKKSADTTTAVMDKPVVVETHQSGLSLPSEKSTHEMELTIKELTTEINNMKSQLDNKDNNFSELKKRYDDLQLKYHKEMFAFRIWFSNKDQGKITFEDLQPHDDTSIYQAKIELNNLTGFEKQVKDLELTTKVISNSKLFDDFHSGTDEDRERYIREYARRTPILKDYRNLNIRQTQAGNSNIAINDTETLEHAIQVEAERMMQEDKKLGKVYDFSIYKNRAKDKLLKKTIGGN